MTGLITPAARAARTVAVAALESPASAYGAVDAIVFALDAAGLLRSADIADEPIPYRLTPEVERLRGEAAGHAAHAASLLNQLRAGETAAGLVTEYRVPLNPDDTQWLLVRREPHGNRWAILASHRVNRVRQAWVGGRWQALPVVGPAGLWEYDTAEAALTEATRLAEGGERP